VTISNDTLTLTGPGDGEEDWVAMFLKYLLGNKNPEKNRNFQIIKDVNDVNLSRDCVKIPGTNGFNFIQLKLMSSIWITEYNLLIL